MNDERPAPARFPLTDKRVYDAYVAGRQSAALAAGVRAGLFDRLGTSGSGMTFDELRRSLGWSERGLRSMLSALGGMGLIERENSDPVLYACSPDAAAYLTRGTPGSLAGLIDMEVDHFLSPRALLDALEKDDASVYGDADPWEAHEDDPDRARAFTAAMHAVSERPAAGLAAAVDLSGTRSILDVGGGSGALSIALCEANSELRSTVFEIAAVCPLTREYVANAGLGDRIDVQAGNMFEEELPRGRDAVLYSQILHDWGHAKGEALLRAAREALEPGGKILIHEKLVEDEADAPLANVLVHLDMLVWTEGQQYSGAELRAMLGRTGFSDVQVIPTTGYWSVVIATAGP